MSKSTPNVEPKPLKKWEIFLRIRNTITTVTAETMQHESLYLRFYIGEECVAAFTRHAITGYRLSPHQPGDENQF